MLITIRDQNTGGVLAHQQISDDSGTFQQDQLAEKLIERNGLDKRDVYVAVQRGDIAIRKFEL